MNHGRLRVAALALGLAFLGMLILSASGGGWIAAACGVAVVLVLWRRWMAWVVVPAAGIAGGAAVMFYHQTAWLQQTFATSSLAGRVTFWINTLDFMSGRHLITGIGLGSWTESYRQFIGESQIHVHNTYLQLYTDTGLLGILAMVAAAVVFVRLAARMLTSSRQDPRYGIAIGMIGASIAGAVMAIYEVTTTVTVIEAAGYLYMSVPLLWVWAALFVVSQQRLAARNG